MTKAIKTNFPKNFIIQKDKSATRTSLPVHINVTLVIMFWMLF